jgi:hypothetical protein
MGICDWPFGANSQDKPLVKPHLTDRERAALEEFLTRLHKRHGSNLELIKLFVSSPTLTDSWQGWKNISLAWGHYDGDNDGNSH